MKLTDISPKETWAELENEIWERFGMRPRVYDTEGVGFTDVSFFGNDLCKMIQSTPKAQTFICAVAHNNMATMARNTRQPVIEECDAGLIKVVVPIFVKDEFVGAAGACGKLVEDGEVDAFMVNRSSDVPEDRVEELAKTVPSTTRKEMEELARFVSERVEKIIKDYEQGTS